MLCALIYAISNSDNGFFFLFSIHLSCDLGHHFYKDFSIISASSFISLAYYLISSSFESIDVVSSDHENHSSMQSLSATNLLLPTKWPQFWLVFVFKIRIFSCIFWLELYKPQVSSTKKKKTKTNSRILMYFYSLFKSLSFQTNFKSMYNLQTYVGLFHKKMLQAEWIHKR